MSQVNTGKAALQCNRFDKLKTETLYLKRIYWKTKQKNVSLYVKRPMQTFRSMDLQSFCVREERNPDPIP